jgi:hypothetical protein
MMRNNERVYCQVWPKKARTAPKSPETNGPVLVEDWLKWRCERDLNPRIMVLQTIALDHLAIAP